MSDSGRVLGAVTGWVRIRRVGEDDLFLVDVGSVHFSAALRTLRQLRETILEVEQQVKEKESRVKKALTLFVLVVVAGAAGAQKNEPKGKAKKEPIAATAQAERFVTTNVCRMVNGAYTFRGHDGVVGTSHQSCTEAFTEWAYTLPPAVK